MSMSIRKANEDDCMFLFELRNHPKVRAASFNSEPLDYEKHKSWFMAALKDEKRIIYIAEDDKPIGMLRFDIKGSHASINVAVWPDAHGRGIGTRLIREGSNKFLGQAKTEKIIAEIKPENIASIRAFEKAGYVKISDKVEMEYAGA